jgi:hypothetical protein
MYEIKRDIFNNEEVLYIIWSLQTRIEKTTAVGMGPQHWPSLARNLVNGSAGIHPPLPY